MKNHPCQRDCPERTADCRLTCKRYKEHFAEQQAEYAAKTKARNARGDIDDYVKREVQKSRAALPTYRRR